MSRLLDHLLGVLRKGETATLVTVLAVSGSSPRNPGAHMLVLSNGTISGTIGGGELEWQAIEETRSDRTVAWQREFILGPDLGQCCGGRLTLQFERCSPEHIPVWQAIKQNADHFFHTVFDEKRGEMVRRQPSPALLDKAPVGLGNFAQLDDKAYLERFNDLSLDLTLFGAGHVGKALVMALATLPIKVTWLDNRPEIFPTLLPIATGLDKCCLFPVKWRLCPRNLRFWL